MKRLMFLLIGCVFVCLILFPIKPAAAQSQEVVITYPGDTDETIARRLKWIEGAKKEGKLMWWTSYTPHEVPQLIAPFKKLYPFIEVEYWRGRDIERVTKLEGEHTTNRLSVDIMEGGAPENFPRWRKMGVFAQFVDIIPRLAKWDKRSYSKYGDWAMPEHTPMAPTYNTRLVSAAEAPKKWEDLLDSKWKGQIGLTQDMKCWYMLALGENGWGVERTEDFLRQLSKQKLIWVSGHTAGHMLMIAEEFKISAEDYIRRVIEPPPKAEGLTEFVRVSPVPVPGSNYVLMQKGPHPNAARLFLEWFLSPQGLLNIEKNTGKGSVFPGSGTKQAVALEGLDLIFKTEEMVLKAADMGLIDRFSKAIGIIR